MSARCVIRLVVDPGVFISALIGRRGAAPDLVVRALIDDRVQVIACPALIAELEGVLRRPKFTERVDDRAVRGFVARVTRHLTIVDDPSASPAVTRDPEDDYLVALAREHRAEAVISGDGDLLEAGLRSRPYGRRAAWWSGSVRADHYTRKIRTARETPPHTRAPLLSS